MDMSGEYRISAPRQVVWDALNDPEVLKQAIAGCEELERNEDGGFSAKVRAKVGPVSARFAGKVSIVDPDPPNGYRIEGEGTGGAAGFAKGGANVALAEDGGDTVLTYEANASVGGKLAQIGSRLIDGTAKKMADDFFAKFSEIVAERASAAAPVVEEAPSLVEQAGDAAEEALDKAKEAVEDAAEVVAEKVEEVTESVAEAAEETVDAAATASKGVPQWMWFAGAAVVVVALILVLT